MKRMIALLLAVMLFVAVMPVAAFADSTKTAYISRRGSGSINMLKGPGYDYAYTGNYVKHNDKVTVKKTTDGWAKITVKRTGKTGWIRDYYVDGTTKKLGTGTHAMKKKANVYAKASNSSTIKKKLDVGDTVKVYETSHDFAYVHITGSSVRGWVPMRCIGGKVDTEPDKPSSGSSTVYHVKATHGLHLRAGASTSYKSYRVLPNGTAFIVKSKSGNWYKIKVLKTGEVGWVSKTYTAKYATGRVATNSSNLNVRKSPGTGSAVLGSLKKGTKVTVKSANGNWAYITFGSLKGWSSLTYLAF